MDVRLVMRLGSTVNEHLIHLQQALRLSLLLVSCGLCFCMLNLLAVCACVCMRVCVCLHAHTCVHLHLCT